MCLTSIKAIYAILFHAGDFRLALSSIPANGIFLTKN